MTMPLNRRRYSRWRLRRIVDRANFGGLVVGGARQVIEVRPDPVGQRPEDLVHPQRVGAGIGLELLVFEAGQRRAAQAVAQHDLLDSEDPLEHRDIDAGPEEAVRCPSASSARFPAGGARPVRTGTTCR